MPVQSTKIVQVKLEILSEDAINNIKGARQRISELKRDMELLKSVGKGNSEEFIALETEMKSLNGVIRANQNVLQNDIRSMEECGTSLNALRAELANAKAEYAAMGDEAKNSTAGINAQLRVEELQAQVKQLEQGIGDYTRNVGNYENAMRAALEGTMPLRTAMKEIRNELGALNLQYQNAQGIIETQRAKVQELATTTGTSSEEYRNAQAELQRLETEYENLGNTIQDMTQKAGVLSDTMNDTSASIKNAGADAAQWQAAKQGAEVLLNSYTALHAGMTALGIESEELINVFAKLQILQQGLNAVNAIAQALQKQSILRQQLQVLWTNLTTKSLGSLIAAKRKDAAASVTATAATGVFATGEVAATGTTWGLKAALDAVKVAIMNIPIIGWILAAVAALGTLIGLIVKANKEEDLGEKIAEDILKSETERKRNLEEIARKERAVYDEKVKQLEALDNLDKDSRLYNDNLKSIADYLGVSTEYAETHKDELKGALEYALQLQMATQQIAENEKASVDAQNEKKYLLEDVNDIIHSGYETSQDMLDNMVQQGKITEDQGKRLKTIRNQYAKHKITEAEATRRIKEELAAQIGAYDKIIARTAEEKKKLEEQKKAAQELLNTLQTDSDKSTKSTKSTSSAPTAADYRKKELDERRKTEDEVYKILEDSLEKQIALYNTSLDRKIEDLKKKLKEEKALNKKAREEINSQIALLEMQRNTKLQEIRTKYNNASFKEEMDIQKKRYQMYLKMANPDSEKAVTISNALLDMEKEAQKKSVEEWRDAQQKKYQEWVDIGKLEVNERAKVLEKMGLDEEGFQEKRKEALKNYQNALVDYEQRNAEIDAYYKQLQLDNEKAFEEKKAQMKADAANTDKEAEFTKRLNDIEVGAYQDKEVRKTAILLEQSQYRESLAQAEVDRLKSLTDDEVMSLYGTQEAYDNALANANSKLITEQGNVKMAMKESTTAIVEQKKQTMNNAIAIGSAIGSMADNIAGLFDTLAEDNDKYNDFATGMAMAQIMISMAVSIAQAIQAATTAGAETGIMAPAMIPVFIAELVGIVASGVASAVTTLKKAKEQKSSKPKFAKGGYVSEGQSGVDKVPAMLTLGEYVIKKPVVDKLGVDFFDRLNGGNIGFGSRGHYANGGQVLNSIALAQQSIDYEAIKDAMRDAVAEVTPVVSVKEVTNVQNRIKAKEDISRR